MKLRLANNLDPTSLASRLRRNRMAQFLQLTKVQLGALRILDVGGTLQFWVNSWPVGGWEKISVTLLNISNQQIVGELPITSVEGDARDLHQFGNGEFDWCFSNSVI